MENDDQPIIDSFPAPYPKTSPTELQSKITFESLLSTVYVKPDLRVMDKYPNTDGHIELTDQQQHPIGKIEVQLKTLADDDLITPKYQCAKHFLKYCSDSILPVILVAVNNAQKKAFWISVDEDVIIDADQRINGETVNIKIPYENCIDGQNHAYLAAWEKLIQVARTKVKGYNGLLQDKELLETKLEVLEEGLRPSTLSPEALAEIHIFLNHYNTILETEFAVLKQTLYTRYWKIGIGIASYTMDRCAFVLIPLDIGRNDPIIRELAPDSFFKRHEALFDGTILSYAAYISQNNIRTNPLALSYSLLKSEFFRIMGKYNFPINDPVIAHEYLISFIDSFWVTLGFEPEQNTYALKQLNFILREVLPVEVAQSHNFADWVKEFNYNIDGTKNTRLHPNLTKRKEAAISLLKTDFVPVVKVTISSELYHIELIYYYLDLLLQSGEENAVRVYHAEMGPKINMKFNWAAWNRPAIFANLELFFKNFTRLYQKYVYHNFRHLQEELNFFDHFDTIFYVLVFDDDLTNQPFLEVYKLNAATEVLPQNYFFKQSDPACPVSRKERFEMDKWDCDLNGVHYKILSVGVQTLDFLFELSPTYSLINKQITKKLKEFFKSKEEVRDTY
ncbi:DUF4365 domain-containing protein [Mucilaginibacter gotjawali]|uniref:Uncharacterized protein n=2 Tax=Mucilaginibacter gotjawali TaxID=1550579 RepID=A0A0X8X4W1_9SPHI|nr:DUF4365 domain-containing protein [Mucilaginibacter gotjawali]MBB3058730.1 hypothetical protein [Mucilaginibacter gotjawali]BAU55666.1 hypothetical protein MgSA37_03857 [Mucilaginibacter gotjawali]